MPPAKRKKSEPAPEPAAGGPSAAEGDGGDAGAPARVNTAVLDLGGVQGQARAISVLRTAIGSGRIHHAWIFHGPAGVGKFTTACAFAAEVLGVPPARLRAHPDFHVVRKELALISRVPEVRRRKLTNIPRDVLLEFLVEPLTLFAHQPGAGPVKKVFVVDEAEMLDVSGQNTLLKALEEPPAGSLIILVTNDEMVCLPTIRSRAHRVGFQTLDRESMARWVSGAGVRMDPVRREWLITAADGSPGAFMNAAASGLYEWHEALEPKLAQADRGTPPFDLGSAMAALVDTRAAATAKETANGSKEVANRMWARRMFEFLGRRYGAKVRDPGASPAARAAAVRAIHLLDRAEMQIDANVRFPDVVENFVAQVGAGTAGAR
ncbi:MAG: hypothetical protein ACT4PL_07350 [Phycisphaerales bacterium]